MDLRLSVDDNVARAKSRIIALRILGLTLRLMENWRRPFSDPDNAMIMLAIAAIVGEKLTRASVDPGLEDLATPVPHSDLTPCNISSIAAATGINRETARRKIKKLITAGLIDRASDGSINLSVGFSQRQEPSDIVRVQLEAVTRLANELLRDRVLAPSDQPF